MTYLLGIDAGTIAMKAVLFDLGGGTVASASEEIVLQTPAPDRVELEPERYWEACCQCTGRVVQQSGVSPEQIAGLAISSQGETLIVLDEAGQPLRPAIVWLDNRSHEEASELEAKFGVEAVFQVTGQPEVVPTWPATKILWLQHHQANVFRRAHKYLLVEDYLLYRFTGRYVADGCLHTSSLLYDIRQSDWWPEMLAAVGLDRKQLPELLPSGYAVAELTPAAAQDSGLWQGTIAATGGIDQALAALGAGNTRSGVFTESTGGALAVVATTDGPLFDPQQRVPCHDHALPQTYCLLAWCQTAGMFLRWFRDNFGQEEMAAARAAGKDSYDVLTATAGALPAGSEGLVALPHLTGAACPEFNPQARGVFYGIGLHHSKPHFVRAILESVAYMLRRNVELLEELGLEAREIRSLGGGSRSGLWNQIKADVLGKPVITVANEEAACLGAAILAGTALGLYPSAAAAAENLVSVQKRWEPDPAQKPTYDRGYDTYVGLYDSLVQLFGAN